MKKINILLYTIILVSFAGCTNNKQQTNSISTMNDQKSTNTIWSSINETTWFKENGWTGETFVFYTDNHNVKKCIQQGLGSGVTVTSRRFVDLEIIDSDKIKIEGIVYKLEGKNLVSDNISLTLFSSGPVVLSNTCGVIDIEFVKSDEFVVENLYKGCNQKK